MKSIKTIVYFIIIFLPAIALAGGNITNDSFGKAKKPVVEPGLL